MKNLDETSFLIILTHKSNNASFLIPARVPLIISGHHTDKI